MNSILQIPAPSAEITEWLLSPGSRHTHPNGNSVKGLLTSERSPGRVNPDFDNEASLREARARMPLEAVLEQYGVQPQNGHFKSFTCPFCKKPGAGLFERDGLKFFKCFHTTCPAGTKALPDVQFIAQSTGLSNRDAFVAFLKMAGVWKERAVLKSPQPVQAKSVEPPPEITDAQADAAAGSLETPVSPPGEPGDSSEIVGLPADVPASAQDSVLPGPEDKGLHAPLPDAGASAHSGSGSQDSLLPQVIELAKTEKISGRSIAKRFGIRATRAYALVSAVKSGKHPGSI